MIMIYEEVIDHSGHCLYDHNLHHVRERVVDPDGSSYLDTEYMGDLFWDDEAQRVHVIIHRWFMDREAN